MTFSSDALRGRTYLITGGSSGIGRATAELAAASGARIALIGRDEGRLRNVLQVLPQYAQHTCRAVETMSDPDLAEGLTQDLAAEVGGFDGVLHAAGAELVLPMRLTKARHIELVFGAAVFGAIGIARAASKPAVFHDGASLVFMSSAAARRGRPGLVLYGAAKATVEGMVKSLACELAPRRVRVNALAAGGVRTAMHDRLSRVLPQTTLQTYENAHPLGMGEASDVAAAAVFLLSPAARWITGSIMDVDGGLGVA